MAGLLFAHFTALSLKFASLQAIELHCWIQHIHLLNQHTRSFIVYFLKYLFVKLNYIKLHILLNNLHKRFLRSSKAVVTFIADSNHKIHCWTPIDFTAKVEWWNQ